ncbi:hypothetical protein FQR65_LT08190 [Abscondita terminalis]|nr:hypothetical protein FQR65_LT08190 [Abscondita terminalis]
MLPQTGTQAVATLALVGVSTILSYYFYKKITKKRIPTKWEPIGTVSEMFMYPLKSGRRSKISSAKCTNYGLQSDNPSWSHFRDRCLVVYKEGVNEVKNAQTFPKIIQIKTNAEDNNRFSLNAPGMETLILEVPKSTCKEDYIELWRNEKILSIDCGNNAAEWISKYLLGESSGMRIGYHDAQHRRNIEKYYSTYKKMFPSFGNFAGGMYSNLSTLMIMTKSSVDDLMQRLQDSEITVNNFRPNVLIEGSKIKPYDEDNWEWIKIGDVVFQKVMVCGRCPITTINPETGEFSKDHEPLTTLKKYRTMVRTQAGRVSPIMGIHVGMMKGGSFKVADTVYIGKY